LLEQRNPRLLDEIFVLEILSYFISLYFPDLKENKLMRKDWWLRNQPPSLNRSMEGYSR
jgi:hypothetical protein